MSVKLDREQGETEGVSEGQFMPRYFFHVHDGTDLPDEEGTELPSLDAAKKHAVQYAASLLYVASSSFWSGADWSLDATDHRGLLLFTLHFFATESAAAAAH